MLLESVRNEYTLAPISYDTTETLKSEVNRIGRTEDVTGSPDGSRLALAAFNANLVYVFSTRMNTGASGCNVEVLNSQVLVSTDFDQPHGLSFLGNDHLLVCNRGGDVCLYRLPGYAKNGQPVSVTPVLRIEGKGLWGAVVKTPGSVAAYELGNGRYRVLICSDQWHFVTSHVIQIGDRFRLINEGVSIEAGLNIPDGICLSSDNRWIAISNHVDGQVVIYENEKDLNRKTHPVARLDGPICPHGLAFDGEGALYAADGTSPFLYRFEKPAEAWTGQYRPTQLIRVLSDEAFFSGRYSLREGGAKGVFIDQRNGLLITTHKLGTLQFWDLSCLQPANVPVDEETLNHLRRFRDKDLSDNQQGVIQRRWKLSDRLKAEWDQGSKRASILKKSLKPKISELKTLRVNRSSRESILGPGGPTVSITSHSLRVPMVYQAIESIARGSLKPGRIILWIGADVRLPDTLRRLEVRGLEIRRTKDYGPHSKYFPYVLSEDIEEGPLVVADDDVIYPSLWLERLLCSYDRQSDAIHCYQARRARLNRHHFEPYKNWSYATGKAYGGSNFITTSLGAILPSNFLKKIKDYGQRFRMTAPTMDGVWLSYIAFCERFEVCPVDEEGIVFGVVPGSQSVKLYDTNIKQGEGQLQLSNTFDRDARLALQNH